MAISLSDLNRKEIRQDEIKMDKGKSPQKPWQKVSQNRREKFGHGDVSMSEFAEMKSVGIADQITQTPEDLVKSFDQEETPNYGLPLRIIGTAIVVAKGLNQLGKAYFNRRSN